MILGRSQTTRIFPAVACSTLLFTSVVSILHNDAYAAGSGCGLFLEFDKYVFENESIIPITISDECQIYSGKIVALAVSSADTEIDPETGWPSATSDDRYLDRRITVTDSITQINFEVPKSTSEYRFLITLWDNMDEITDQAIVFTKKDADVIHVSELSIPESIDAGSELEMSFKLTDGIGNPVASIVTATAAIQRPLCEPSSWPSSIMDLHMTRTAESGYAGGTYQGQTALPVDFSTGLYNVVISFYSAPSEGYRYPEPVTSQLRVEGKSPPVTTMFHNIRAVNPSLFANSDNDFKFSLGDDIVITGQTLTDDCIPISSVNVTGDFLGYPTPLIRSSAISNEHGNFTLHFQTHPLLQTDMQYYINLRGNYSNNTYSWTNDYVSLDDITKFPFKVNGFESSAEVKSDHGEVISMTLNEEAKKIVIILQSERNQQAQYDIAIPSELLSGDIIIQKDGGMPLVLIGNEYFADMAGPVNPPDSRHSYYLHAHKRDGMMAVGFVDIEGSRTTIEVTGTSVIPEFGSFAALLMAAGIVGALVLMRRLQNCRNS